jgi:hypothetical protein
MGEGEGRKAAMRTVVACLKGSRWPQIERTINQREEDGDVRKQEEGDLKGLHDAVVDLRKTRWLN